MSWATGWRMMFLTLRSKSSYRHVTSPLGPPQSLARRWTDGDTVLSSSAQPRPRSQPQRFPQALPVPVGQSPEPSAQFHVETQRREIAFKILDGRKLALDRLQCRGWVGVLRQFNDLTDAGENLQRFPLRGTKAQSVADRIDLLNCHDYLSPFVLVSA